MPKNPYPGRKIYATGNYFETKVEFDLICEDPKLTGIELSPSQRAFDSEKVARMVDEYKIHPDYIRFKNRIVVAVLHGKWYLVDGQHRVEMAKQLYGDHGVNDHFFFCWHTCRTGEDMRNLFNSLNLDSIGNEYYVSKAHMTQVKIDEFVKILKIRYKHLFAPKASNNDTHNIADFRDQLIQDQFFDEFTTGQDALNHLLQKNKEFFEINRYQVGLDNGDISNYYKNDHNKLREKFIISSKHCNFLKWLHDPLVEEPYHRRKREKRTIVRRQRTQLWVQTYGSNETCKCPITSCKTSMHLGTNDWHAGHIISERHGGETVLTNLKPICASCNFAMGSKDWMAYDPGSL